MFYFKSSKKSNNGTDVNAGQIPQMLYRVVTPESQTPNRQADHAEPVYILCRDFSRAVNRVSFKLSADTCKVACVNLSACFEYFPIRMEEFFYCFKN